MTRSAGQLPNDVDTTHTHWRSDIIDPQTREAAEFDAGGVQQVRLLGPYRVDWDNSDVVDPSAYFPVFDEIAAGSLVEPFVVVAEVFDGGATAEIGVDVVDGGPFTTLLTAIYDLTQATDNPAAFSEAHWPGASLTLLEANSPHKAIARAPCRIKLAIWTGGGETITQGAIDIYALIAEPA